MDIFSILNHESTYICSNEEFTDSMQFSYMLMSGRFADKFPKTTSEFIEASCDHTEFLEELIHDSHYFLMRRICDEIDNDDDIKKMIIETPIVSLPHPNANAFTTAKQHHPAIYILYGLADLAIFFNSIMYAYNNYIRNATDNSILWRLCHKFIIGKQKHNFYLPSIITDLNDSKMLQEASIASKLALCFVMMHEHCHNRLNHAKVDFKMSIQQEFDADSMAINLMENKNVALHMALEFFKLIQLLDYLNIESTHPYCHKRLLNLFNKYEEQMMPFLKKMYLEQISRTEKIYVAFNSGRNPLINAYNKLKVFVFNLKLHPIPNISDLADYNSSKDALYALINKGRLHVN